MNGDSLLDRRKCVKALVASWGLRAGAAQTQPVKKAYRVGILVISSQRNSSEYLADILAGLARYGIVERTNLVVDYRFADGEISRLDSLARELVALQPDVIFTMGGTRAAQATMKATTSIPIVFEASGDPVGAGLVNSLSHPGRNLTGNAVFGAELDLKRLQMLSEALGHPADLAVFDDAISDTQRKSYLDPSLDLGGAKLHFVGASNSRNLPDAFDQMTRLRVAGVLIAHSPFTAAHTETIAQHIAQHRLPAIADGEKYADAGILLTYTTDWRALFQRSADYLQRILKGAKPADLPVEHASHFEMVINLRTARALGLRLSPSFRLRADRVIE